ncbi:unnamed protein product [Vitrella brassicaformis CCMP3155]|uniref:Secreted protein n=2 Tax=Vitrella brassicaformis TaxID=1169539 RepID=A0A0G4H5F9_VITBC|nr:unnamed protein product [Vitrella brassicaformis CCMP3155]|mmetsp:Transcript_37273/g.93554  ORF Transcript_37273/g.93554 Transcript_37273/m.93554 type:complete len:259 (+) Transcript_37273:107-883(+)|eukprot:CEM39008.1 unnamed protein product [Vitrella brassicaformis CCMP3155]
MVTAIRASLVALFVLSAAAGSISSPKDGSGSNATVLGRSVEVSVDGPTDGPVVNAPVVTIDDLEDWEDMEEIKPEELNCVVIPSESDVLKAVPVIEEIGKPQDLKPVHLKKTKSGFLAGIKWFGHKLLAPKKKICREAKKRACKRLLKDPAKVKELEEQLKKITGADDLEVQSMTAPNQEEPCKLLLSVSTRHEELASKAARIQAEWCPLFHPDARASSPPLRRKRHTHHHHIHGVRNPARHRNRDPHLSDLRGLEGR